MNYSHQLFNRMLLHITYSSCSLTNQTNHTKLLYYTLLNINQLNLCFDTSLIKTVIRDLMPKTEKGIYTMFQILIKLTYSKKKIKEKVKQTPNTNANRYLEKDKKEEINICMLCVWACMCVLFFSFHFFNYFYFSLHLLLLLLLSSLFFFSFFQFQLRPIHSPNPSKLRSTYTFIHICYQHILLVLASIMIYKSLDELDYETNKNVLIYIKKNINVIA